MASDPGIPTRLRRRDLAERYQITPRLAGIWLRRMESEGIIRKNGMFHMGRIAAVDRWVESGGAS